MPDLPHVEYHERRKEHRITLTGAWFPKRDDVQGVIKLRRHLAERLPASLFDIRDDVFVDIYLQSPDIDIDRALTGVCTALDGQHGNVGAALWDDSVIRQARVTRIVLPLKDDGDQSP